MADARVEEYGAGYLSCPLNEWGADWLRNFAPSGTTRISDALLVEPADLEEVVEDMRYAGLDVED